MKRRLWVMVVVCLGVAAFCASAVAGDEAEGKRQRREREERRARMERHRDPLGAEIRFAEQLRDKVEAELDLGEEQRAAISKLFSDHLEAVKKMAAKQPEPADQEDQRERIRELERKAHAAREAGDREQALEFYREIRELRQGASRGDLADLGRMNRELIRDVGEVLNEEQVAQFRRLVRQVRARSASGGAMRQLMRAVRRAVAELELDEEQRAAVGIIVRDAMKGIDRSQESPQVIGQFIEQVGPKLRSELGPELAEKFLAELEKAREEMQAPEKAPVPPSERDTPPAEPEKKTSDQDTEQEEEETD